MKASYRSLVVLDSSSPVEAVTRMLGEKKLVRVECELSIAGLDGAGISRDMAWCARWVLDVERE